MSRSVHPRQKRIISILRTVSLLLFQTTPLSLKPLRLEQTPSKSDLRVSLCNYREVDGCLHPKSTRPSRHIPSILNLVPILKIDSWTVIEMVHATQMVKSLYIDKSSMGFCIKLNSIHLFIHFRDQIISVDHLYIYIYICIYIYSYTHTTHTAVCLPQSRFLCQRPRGLKVLKLFLESLEPLLMVRG